MRNAKRLAIVIVTAAAAAVSASLAIGCKDDAPYPLELTDEQTRVLGQDLAGLPDEGLVDQDGEPFSFDAVQGKPAVGTAIYTSCPMPDMCPLLTSKVAQVQSELAERGVDRDAYQVLLLSFDPVTDSPAKMVNYAKEHSLELGNAHLVTGDKDTLDDVMDRLEVGAKPADDGTIMHNMRTYVVGSDGAIRYGFRQSGWEPAHVAERVESLVD